MNDSRLSIVAVVKKVGFDKCRKEEPMFYHLIIN